MINSAAFSTNVGVHFVRSFIFNKHGIPLLWLLIFSTHYKRSLEGWKHLTYSKQAGLNSPERGQVLGGNKGAAGGVACSRLLVLSRAPGPASLRSRSINDLCRVPGEPGALGQKGEKK